MLVRSSEALREEIMGKLRSNYLQVIMEPLDSVKQHLTDVAPLVLDEVLGKILNPNALEAIKSLRIQQANDPQYTYLHEVKTCIINFCEDASVMDHQLDSTTTQMIDSKILETYNTYSQMQVFTNKVGYAFKPQDRLTLHLDGCEEIASVVTFSRKGLYININMGEIDHLGGLLDPMQDSLRRVYNEHKHFEVLLNYFWELCDELPSLNRMYKICPGILNYVKKETKDNLFKTSTGAVDPAMDILSPTDEINVALGRNKLRGY
jgi:hypothetical protein